MTRYLHVHPAGRWAVLRMTGTNGRAWLTSRQLPAVWSTSRRGYLIRGGKLPDVLAMAQADGWRVSIHDAVTRNATRNGVTAGAQRPVNSSLEDEPITRAGDGNPELPAIIAELGGKCGDCGRWICTCEAAS